jgi:phage N-6-adenine-methyltransferase
MEEIIVNAALKELAPPLESDGFQGLEESILSEGCRDALVLWNHTLVDGHNRYEICTKHNIEFQTIQRDFLSIEHAKEWIILNQYSRRNLNSYQRGMLALKLKDIYHKIAKENQKLSKGRGKKGTPILAGVKGDVRDKLARIAKLSHGNIDKIKLIENKATEETKKLLEAGKISVHEVYKELKEPAQSQNSGTHDWHTPSNFIEAARLTMGSIDLDPASSEIANKRVQATTFFTAETNGLDKPWSGNVWMNPPYTQPLIEQFVKKLIQELPNINQACVIVNNATDTTWFHILLEHYAVACLIKGRVKFLEPIGSKGNPLQGQVIFYFGTDVSKFETHFSSFGKMVNNFNLQQNAIAESEVFITKTI